MASIEKIKPGQVLHDYHKVTMGNTTMRQTAHYTVKVIEVDLEHRRALCSWNGNEARWYSEHDLKRFMVNEKKKSPRDPFGGLF